ncbi:MAG: histidine phosphatase family protein [Alphaproteobacteria bacterium]
MTIYLMRHGETEWNVAGRLQGQKDSPLTARGRAQAAAMGRRLAPLLAVGPPLTLWASALDRSWHTARLLAAELACDPAAIRRDARLNEQSLGPWDGLTDGEMMARDEAAWTAWRRPADLWMAAAPGGESRADMALRARAWLDTIDMSATHMVVGHGVFNRILRGVYGGFGRDRVTALESFPHEAILVLERGRETWLDG